MSLESLNERIALLEGRLQAMELLGGISLGVCAMGSIVFFLRNSRTARFRHIIADRISLALPSKGSSLFERDSIVGDWRFRPSTFSTTLQVPELRMMGGSINLYGLRGEGGVYIDSSVYPPAAPRRSPGKPPPQFQDNLPSNSSSFSDFGSNPPPVGTHLGSGEAWALDRHDNALAMSKAKGFPGIVVYGPDELVSHLFSGAPSSSSSLSEAASSDLNEAHNATMRERHMAPDASETSRIDDAKPREWPRALKGRAPNAFPTAHKKDDKPLQ